MSFRFIIILVLTLLVKSSAAQQKLSKKEFNIFIDSVIHYHIYQKNIPGAVLLIKKGNKTILHKAYGFAQLKDKEDKPLKAPIRMTKNHLFDIASLTKVIGTTTSIMYLADKGLISVEDKVGKYIPAFKMADKENITIRHLLTHTSGLYAWYPMYYKSSSKYDTYLLISKLPLQDSIGKLRKYSDLGFTILGQIIETVTNRILDKFEQEYIFKPLRMQHTCYNPLSKNNKFKIASTSFGNPFEKRMVYDSTLHMRPKEIDPATWNRWRKYTLTGEVNDGNSWYASGGVSGAAGLFSTAADIQKLVDMLLKKGGVSGKQFISGKTIEQFLTKDKFLNGLGWMMDTTNSFIKDGPPGSFGHTGFTGTSIAVIPQNKLSIILLTNRQQTGLSETGNYPDLGNLRKEIVKLAMNYLIETK